MFLRKRERERKVICSEMGIERGREMGIERETNQKKMGTERERERERVLYIGS